MNFATILIILAVAVLFVLAVRYLLKYGMCGACENRAVCRNARKVKGAGDSGCTNFSPCCSGKCSSCRYFELEKAAAEKNKK